MRYTFFVTLLIGCTEYKVHSTAEDPGAPADPAVEPIETTVEIEISDTGEVVDTGDPADVEVPTEPVYLHTDRTLYAWDPDESALSIIGDFHTDDGDALDGITDIAIDPIGRFYGVTDAQLVSIDPSDAMVTVIADIPSPLYGLTCTSDGRLVGGGDGLVLIDTVTGEFETLVPEGAYMTSGDLVGLPDGLLYWAVREGDDLVVADPDSGVTSMRGAIGFWGVYGLGYAGSDLYGFTADGLVLRIDATNGEVLEQQDLPGEWWGATTNPVLW